MLLGLFFVPLVGVSQNSSPSSDESAVSKEAVTVKKTASVSTAQSSSTDKSPTGVRDPSLRQMRLGRAEPTPSPSAEINVIMSDPHMKKKWDLEKINVEDAWLKFSKGSRDIVVAVIDTGIDVRHPDLKDNIWKNPKEIPGNGIDDDNNCYIDDVHGWNFVPADTSKISKAPECKGKSGSPNMRDTHGHGTHIAGIIGAVGGNGEGLSGVAPKVSLMALKYYDPNDSGNSNLNNTIKAIHYAVENGAHIINYSGGGLEPNKLEQQAIKEAERKGILVVAAAGNESSNTDKSGYYPANYPLNNILSVTTIDPLDRVLKSSNYGKKTVHNAAPGSNILSTLPGGRYGRMTGTSQATAVATGAAVLIMDYYKNKTARFVIKHLKMTGDIKSSLEGKTSQGRGLNIYKALQARGKHLNFMDEDIDTKGRSFSSEKDIADIKEEPFNKRDMADLKMMNEVLNDTNKKGNESSGSRSTAAEEGEDSSTDDGSVQGDGSRGKARDPASSAKPGSPSLKRWFLK